MSSVLLGNGQTIAGAPGQSLTVQAADGSLAFSGGLVAKAADETRTGATPANDATLHFSNQPAGTYCMDCGLYFVSVGAVNCSVGFNHSGTFVVGLQSAIATNTNAISGSSGPIDGSTLAVGSAVAGVNTFVRLFGNFVFTTVCNMAVQWTANGAGLQITLKQGSWARLIKIN